MNMANYDYEEQDFEYRATTERQGGPDARRGGSEKSSAKRRMQYSRSSRPAVKHDGIHRRRNKRFAW
jgi:hypothetical protein